jgi:hypothetical protein
MIISIQTEFVKENPEDSIRNFVVTLPKVSIDDPLPSFRRRRGFAKNKQWVNYASFLAWKSIDVQEPLEVRNRWTDKLKNCLRELAVGVKTTPSVELEESGNYFIYSTFNGDIFKVEKAIEDVNVEELNKKHSDLIITELIDFNLKEIIEPLLSTGFETSPDKGLATLFMLNNTITLKNIQTVFGPFSRLPIPSNFVASGMSTVVHSPLILFDCIFEEFVSGRDAPLDLETLSGEEVPLAFKFFATVRYILVAQNLNIQEYAGTYLWI